MGHRVTPYLFSGPRHAARACRANPIEVMSSAYCFTHAPHWQKSNLLAPARPFAGLPRRYAYVTRHDSSDVCAFPGTVPNMYGNSDHHPALTARADASTADDEYPVDLASGGLGALPKPRKPSYGSFSQRRADGAVDHTR